MNQDGAEKLSVKDLHKFVFQLLSKAKAFKLWSADKESREGCGGSSRELAELLANTAGFYHSFL